jgi:hypothetical protein
MQKGFGHYSHQETTIFFLKAILLSFWLGIDMLALLLAFAIPAGIMAEHRVTLVVAITILFSCTLTSILFIWATGSLGEEPDARSKHKRSSRKGKDIFAFASQTLKEQPLMMVAVALGTLCLALPFAVKAGQWIAASTAPSNAALLASANIAQPKIPVQPVPPVQPKVAITKPENPAAQKAAQADPEITAKCVEVVKLEGKLFQSEAQTQALMDECLAQYDTKYATMRAASAPTQRKQ